MSSAVTTNARRSARLAAKRRTKVTVPSRRKPTAPRAVVGNPVRLDPSRTGNLRVMAGKAVRERYARLRTELYRMVVLEDALGLADPPDWFVANAEMVANDTAQPRDARGRWSRVGGGALGVLQRAGAKAEHLEHAVKSYVTDRLEAGVARLPAHLQGPVRATVHAGKVLGRAAFVTWTAGQALAERRSGGWTKAGRGGCGGC
jgi:hypothetical protein